MVLDQAALHSQRCGSVTLVLGIYASGPALLTARNFILLGRICNWHTKHIAPCMHTRKAKLCAAFPLWAQVVKACSAWHVVAAVLYDIPSRAQLVRFCDADSAALETQYRCAHRKLSPY